MQAVLILAHKNFDHVAALSKMLQRKFEIYIHFDKKMKLNTSQTKWLDQNKINYIQEIDVHWGSWSIGEAARRLMRLAMQNPQITYVHLISGQDWPVMNLDDLYEFYKNNDQIYCRFAKASKKKLAGETTLWWQKYYFNYDTVNRRTIFGKFYHRALLYGQRFFRVNKFKRLGIDETIYHGANWCDLPRDAVEYCLQYMDSHPNFVKMLETGCFSDEFWVQTILCNEPHFKKRVTGDFHRFVKWKKQHDSFPAVLDDSDYDAIIADHEAQFARKFDPQYSENLIQKLNRYYQN
ncbi:beta-1,6-N-acetylglucosaminyltransferase [Ligilactobacillus sp. LYQ135]